MIDNVRSIFPDNENAPVPLVFLCATRVVLPKRERARRQRTTGKKTASLSRILKKVFDHSQAFANTNRKRSAARRTSPRRRGIFAINPAVLVVDDVVDVTDMIALFLKHAGYDVTIANSAAAALGLAANQQFDLVISDIGMPEMNGYELAEALRAHTDYRQTPLIAVTGYTEYDDRGRSLQAGFDAHLTKPINPSHLLEVIRQLLTSS